MGMRLLSLGMGLWLSCSLASPQSEHVPPFSGTWVLNLQRSKVEAAHPPVAGEATIRYDGKTWRYTRTQKSAEGEVNTWSIDLVVGSPKPHVTKDGLFVSHSRISEDGDALIMTQEITAFDGQKARNTIRYTVEDNGNTLVEAEREETPTRNETNRWILDRKQKD